MNQAGDDGIEQKEIENLEETPRERALRRPFRANLRKERRRRNTFRVGHTETPQMPSFHNRLLPSAPFLSTRRISSSIFTEDYACLLPPLHITLSYFTLSHSFPIILPSEACSLPLSVFSTLSVLSRFFSHHAFASVCKPSILPINVSLFLIPFPTQQSPLLPCPILLPI